MKEETFSLKGNQFIEMNKLIKFLNWVETGGMVRFVVESEMVKVNNKTELRLRRKLLPGDVIQLENFKVTITE